MAHERDPGGHGIHPMKRVGIPSVMVKGVEWEGQVKGEMNREGGERGRERGRERKEGEGERVE